MIYGNMIPETKLLTDFMSKEPGSCWYNPNDKDTWFIDEALTTPTIDATKVRFLKNKVGLGSLSVGNDGLKSSDYGFYGFYMEFTNIEL